MIEMKRYDHPERTYCRHKITRTIPAFYECRYLWDGKEIAYFDSKDDCLYLRTDYLGGDFKKPYSQRMETSRYAEAFEELSKLLNLSDSSRLSEYTEL